jgi:hypothetical protein
VIDLDEIEARANAATPGPWASRRNRDMRDYEVRAGCVLAIVSEAASAKHATSVRECGRNAAFIAAARTDVPALIARVRELEAECERMKTFAAKSFSQMMCQEVEQMREYGLSYEGVRKVLHEYNDGEISFGKLMDLIRAAARAMAEDTKK